MANRRMFSLTIVDSDLFLEMPVSARCLYYDLSMRADDDGFVNPRKVVRLTNASDDDLKVLAAKRFIIPFENGVVVIKDWKLHNYIRKDTYTETIYKTEKVLLSEDENGAYTVGSKPRQLTVDGASTQVRLGKVRLGKKKDSDFEQKFKEFWELYPNKKSKKRAQEKYYKLVKEHNLIMEGLKKHLPVWAKTDLKYIPHPTTWLNGERWNDELQEVEKSKYDGLIVS